MISPLAALMMWPIGAYWGWARAVFTCAKVEVKRVLVFCFHCNFYPKAASRFSEIVLEQQSRFLDRSHVLVFFT